jgi:hypothetical protein
MYRGVWYGGLAFRGDLHVEAVTISKVSSDISIPVALFPTPSAMSPGIGSPVNIAKGTRL